MSCASNKRAFCKRWMSPSAFANFVRDGCTLHAGGAAKVFSLLITIMGVTTTGSELLAKADRRSPTRLPPPPPPGATAVAPKSLDEHQSKLFNQFARG